MNINRDYLIINDVKKSNVKLDNGSIFFYITDKNTQNIFVNLVINVSNNDLIQKYANIENAEDYTLTMNIVKPSNTYKIIEGKLHDKEKAIFEFDLKEDCCDEIGTYKCELLTKCNINDHEEITTSNKLTYKVKSSVLNDLDDIVEAPEYPLVIQLFDKLSDIEQYEEDRRANELARQLAEEQRQTRFNALDADMTDSIQAIDNKIVEAENRISAKEQAVDKLIVDTKADIDNYKVAKDQEIDEYKTTKDTEINEAIANQDNKIDVAISNQNDRIAVVENNDVAQDNRLNVLENKDVLHESRLDAIEVKNQQQDNRLDIVENKNSQQDNRLDVVEAKNVEQDNRLDEIEAIDVTQNNRLDTIEAKNTEQDDRLLDIEKTNKRQDMNLKCLFAESKNNMIDITEEGNSIYLQNSTIGYTLIDEIKGNTLVNCNKEPDKELILNGNINTSGDNSITLTEGVDGGKVDVALEGNTLVNVSKTKDSTGISKAYTVENSGNHVALQGDIDGSCRPIVTGNTLVNLIDIKGNENISGNTVYSKVTDTEFIFDWSKGQEYNNWIQVRNNVDLIQEGKTYTVIINILENNPTLDGVEVNGEILLHTWFNGFNIVSQYIPYGTTGLYKYTFSAVRNSTQTRNMIGIRVSSKADNVPDSAILINGGKLRISKDILILEGDYTNKPIPDYFEGLQSSFEDNLVTQEMIDNGEEVADNLSKYKVDYKSIREDGTVGNTKTLYLNSPLLEGDTIEEKDGGIYHVHRSKEVVFDGSDDENIIYNPTDYRGQCDVSNTIPNRIYKCINNRFYSPETLNTVDEYDSYVVINGWSNKAMIRNYNVFTDKDSFINYLNQNPVTVVYELSEPQYELIEQSNLAIPSYANGHLDLSSAVPVEKVEFKPFSEELTYLYANTQYTVQFVSDKAITSDITLGGTQLLAQSIVQGLNRVSMTTPSTLVDNKLVINGVGAKISEVVVTDTNREFMYFEGMKSVGECEDNRIEILSHNKNILNIKDAFTCVIGNWGMSVLNNRNPISGTINIEDNTITVSENTNYHYLAFPVDLKKGVTYYLNYNCNKVLGNTISFFTDLNTPRIEVKDGGNGTFVLKQNCKYIGFPFNNTVNSYTLSNLYININEDYGYVEPKSNAQQLTHEPLRAVGDVKDKYILIDGKWYIERNCKQENMSELKFAGDTSNTMKCLILRKSKPKAISNIFSNSRGFESATKGQMYVQERGDGMTYLWIPTDSMSREEFTSFLNEKNATIVYVMAEPTYEPIDYSPLETYSDTTHITTNSTIPTNIVVKNHGYNCLLKPSTTYTISSNLGLNTVTTPSTLTEDCLRFMDTDTSDVTTMKDVLVLEGDWTTKADLIPANFSGIESAFEQEYDAEKGKYKVNVKVANEDKTQENNITLYINEPLRGIDDVKDRVYIKDDKVIVERNCKQMNMSELDFAGDTNDTTKCLILRKSKPKVISNIFSNSKSYSSTIKGQMYVQNRNNGLVYLWIPTIPMSREEFTNFLNEKNATVVYPLAEPVYEEVEYNDTKLFIESFKNSTLFYNSNVPVTSKLYYSYSVPLVDKVSQTANISDEQDVMIIDLATQVAVMEMMLM